VFLTVQLQSQKCKKWRRKTPLPQERNPAANRGICGPQNEELGSRKSSNYATEPAPVAPLKGIPRINTDRKPYEEKRRENGNQRRSSI